MCCCDICFDKAVDTFETVSLMERYSKGPELEDKPNINSHAFPEISVGVYKYTLGVKKMDAADIEGNCPQAKPIFSLIQSQVSWLDQVYKAHLPSRPPPHSLVWG